MTLAGPNQSGKVSFAAGIDLAPQCRLGHTAARLRPGRGDSLAAEEEEAEGADRIGDVHLATRVGIAAPEEWAGL